MKDCFRLLVCLATWSLLPDKTRWRFVYVCEARFRSVMLIIFYFAFFHVLLCNLLFRIQKYRRFITVQTLKGKRLLSMILQNIFRKNKKKNIVTHLTAHHRHSICNSQKAALSFIVKKKEKNEISFLFPAGEKKYYLDSILQRINLFQNSEYN